jgi:copper chaperone CopZ
MSEQHQYKFDITMSCRGCSGAVDRVLKKLEGEGKVSLLIVYSECIVHAQTFSLSAFLPIAAIQSISVARRQNIILSGYRGIVNYSYANFGNLLLGVTSYEVNLESQSATVNTEPSLSYEKVLETIKKTGKTVKAGEADGISMSV